MTPTRCNVQIFLIFRAHKLPPNTRFPLSDTLSAPHHATPPAFPLQWILGLSSASSWPAALLELCCRYSLEFLEFPRVAQYLRIHIDSAGRCSFIFLTNLHRRHGTHPRLVSIAQYFAISCFSLWVLYYPIPAQIRNATWGKLVLHLDSTELLQVSLGNQSLYISLANIELRVLRKVDCSVPRISQL